MPINMVIFDVGGTLIDEQRMWQRHAENLGVATSDLLQVLEATIARREHHHRAFAQFDPTYVPSEGQNPSAAFAAATRFDERDLFPDARQCFMELRARGMKIGIAGNQPASAKRDLEKTGLIVDLNGTSAGWGTAKPDLAFFQKIIETSGEFAERIAYVGDRLDNDVLPAKAVGMTAIFLVRGLWGRTQVDWPEASQVSARISNLSELPGVLEAL